MRRAAWSVLFLLAMATSVSAQGVKCPPGAFWTGQGCTTAPVAERFPGTSSGPEVSAALGGAVVVFLVTATMLGVLPFYPVAAIFAFAVAAATATAAGVVMFSAARTVIHEAVAMLCLVMAAVLGVGAVIAGGVVRLRSLQRAEPPERQRADPTERQAEDDELTRRVRRL